MPQRKGSSGTALREAEAQRCPEKGTGSGLGCTETPASIPKSSAHDNWGTQAFLAEMLWLPSPHGPAWGCCDSPWLAPAAHNDAACHSSALAVPLWSPARGSP